MSTSKAVRAIQILLVVVVCTAASGCALLVRMQDKSLTPIHYFYEGINTLLSSSGESVATSGIHKDDRERVLFELQEHGLLQPSASVQLLSYTQKPHYEVDFSIREYDLATGNIVKRVDLVFVKDRQFWRLKEVHE